MNKKPGSRQKANWFTRLMSSYPRHTQAAVGFAFVFVVVSYGTVLISHAAALTPSAPDNGIILQPQEVSSCQIIMTAKCTPQALQFQFPYQVKIYADSANPMIDGQLVYSGNLMGPASKQISLSPGTYDVHFNAGTLPTRFLSPVVVSSGHFSMQQLDFSNATGAANDSFTDYNGCLYYLHSPLVNGGPECARP